MSKHPIGISANGIQVYAHLTKQPLAAAAARNPHLLTLATKAIASLSLTEQVMIFEHDTGNPIGYSDQLETKEKDSVFYAQTGKMSAYTRFVKLRKAEPTSILTLQLEVDGDDYLLTNIWIGETYPPIPDGQHATSQSIEYWRNHAVVFNGQAVLSSSITKTCPY